jgi:hypothetical protein
MDTLIPVKDIFSLIPNFWYWILAGIFNLFIRAILVVFRAVALNNGEADDSDNEKETKWKGRGFEKAFKHSFWSNGKDIRVDDYWLPSIIGYSELIIFPLLMAKGWIVGIGAWIAIKTASSWGGWQKTRTAYNRFLLGNILSLCAAFFICKIFDL